MRLPKEPFFWSLFSSGGMAAALVLPALAAIWWLAIPLGWVATPGHEETLALLAHPLARLALWALVFLSMFHWAHRFRYTLYDGLQLYHLAALITVVCYGGATVMTAVAAYLLWAF